MNLACNKLSQINLAKILFWISNRNKLFSSQISRFDFQPKYFDLDYLFIVQMAFKIDELN